jgi:hypothetical protein
MSLHVSQIAQTGRQLINTLIHTHLQPFGFVVDPLGSYNASHILFFYHVLSLSFHRPSSYPYSLITVLIEFET